MFAIGTYRQGSFREGAKLPGAGIGPELYPENTRRKKAQAALQKHNGMAEHDEARASSPRHCDEPPAASRVYDERRAPSDSTASFRVSRCPSVTM